MMDLSVREVAGLLGVHTSTVKTAIHRGRIPAYRAGLRKWRIRGEDLEKLRAGALSVQTQK